MAPCEDVRRIRFYTLELKHTLCCVVKDSMYVLIHNNTVSLSRYVVPTSYVLAFRKSTKIEFIKACLFCEYLVKHIQNLSNKFEMSSYDMVFPAELVVQ